MTLIFNGQGFSTLSREQALIAFHKLTLAIVQAKEQAP